MAYTLKNPNLFKDSKGNPINQGLVANDAFINAVYIEKYGRKPTARELADIKQRSNTGLVKDVSNLILGKASPFINYKAPANVSFKDAHYKGASGGNIENQASYDAAIKNGAVPDYTGAPAPAPAPAITPSPTDGLQEPYKSMFEEAKKLLDGLQAKGKMVAADVVITPEKAAEFMTQAQNEIDPYYATEFAKAKTAFLQTQGYDQTDLQRFEQDMERKYGFSQRNVAASAAERGFAQSGIRQQEEQNLAYDTQRVLEANRTNLGRRQQELAQAFAGTYGGKNTPGALNINEAPTVGVEGFVKPTKEKPLYQLSPDLYQNLIGSQEYAKTVAEKARASQLEGAFRENEALKQNRSLTL